MRTTRERASGVVEQAEKPRNPIRGTPTAWDDAKKPDLGLPLEKARALEHETTRKGLLVRSAAGAQYHCGQNNYRFDALQFDCFRIT